jgi:hypothetical protein
VKPRRLLISADLFDTPAHGGDEIILGSGMLPPPNCHDIAFGVSGIDVGNMVIAWRLGIIRTVDARPAIIKIWFLLS